MSSLRDKIRDRRLTSWALGYVAGAFVALQALDALAEPMGLSVFFQQVVLVLIVLGLPVALVLAWFHGAAGAQKVTLPEVPTQVRSTVMTGPVHGAAMMPLTKPTRKAPL